MSPDANRNNHRRRHKPVRLSSPTPRVCAQVFVSGLIAHALPVTSGTVNRRVPLRLRVAAWS